MAATYEAATPEEVALALQAIRDTGDVPTGFAYNPAWYPDPVRRIVLGPAPEPPWTPEGLYLDSRMDQLELTGGLSPEQETAISEAEVASLAFPTVATTNYTRHLSRYASLAAAIADLPSAGINGGEIRVDGEVDVTAITGALPAHVNVIGRGSHLSAVRIPENHASPVFDIDSADGAAVVGIAGLVENDGDAAAGGILVEIRGDLDGVEVEDVETTGYDHAVNVEGWNGTTPGTVRDLRMRRVRGHHSPVGAGMNLDDVDGYVLEECGGTFNWLDGLKLRKKVLNGRIVGGHYNDNGLSGIGGGGINGYAGGDSFVAQGVETARNFSDGMSLKTGPLNSDDSANYGFVRRIQITDPNSHDNQGSGIDLSVASEDIADLTAQVMTEIALTGGILRANGQYGVNNQARNVTATGVHAVHNGQHGFFGGSRSMDWHLAACMAIANGQSAAGVYSGYYFTGRGGAVVGCLAIGADDEGVGQESDYTALTKYHVYGFRWAATASGIWHMAQSESRHHSGAGNGVRVDATTGTFLLHQQGTLTPGSSPIYGGIGSEYIKTNAAVPADVVWRKTSGAPNASTTGWTRVTP